MTTPTREQIAEILANRNDSVGEFWLSDADAILSLITSTAPAQGEPTDEEILQAMLSGIGYGAVRAIFARYYEAAALPPPRADADDSIRYLRQRLAHHATEMATARATLAQRQARVEELERDNAALVKGWPDAWQPIATAPKDGTVVLVYAAEREGLPAFQCTCGYHPDGGWCVDELRFVTHWQPLPPAPALRSQLPAAPAPAVPGFAKVWEPEMKGGPS